MSDIKETKISARGIKLSIERDGKEIARAYLYIMHNDLHEAPFGLMEDVYVEETSRKEGLGTLLVKRLIALAEERGCYKLIGTSRHSRPKVHALYQSLGFDLHGVEFRIDFPHDKE